MREEREIYILSLPPPLPPPFPPSSPPPNPLNPPKNPPNQKFFFLKSGIIQYCIVSDPNHSIPRFALISLKELFLGGLRIFGGVGGGIGEGDRGRGEGGMNSLPNSKTI